MVTSVYQVFGGYSAAKIGGVDLKTPGVQLGDLTIDTFFWPINDPTRDRYWAMGGYIHVPDGNWNQQVATNLGDNRFSGTVQSAYLQGIDHKLEMELVADGTFYGDNTKALGGGTLSEQPTYEGQIWLSYKLSPLTTISFGTSGTFGGYQSIDGLATGEKTEAEQIRFSYAHFFVRPGIQFLLEADHTVHVVGGFGERVGILARFAKVF